MGVAGESVQLEACGALWWEGPRVLVVSDLHLEKASSYAARGQMLPPYDTRATLARVATLFDRLSPSIVISLGDSFHDRRARPRMAEEDVAVVRALSARCDWVWITGNHDPAPPGDLGGRVLAELRIEPFTFRHEPLPGPAPGEIAGHLHPCARVAGRGRSVRARCFVSDSKRLVMPAYGSLAGGLNVLDPAFAPVFAEGFVCGVIGRDGVYAAGVDSLVSDRLRAAG